ncbi:MAG TPA: hypothetical protein VIO87_03775 [Methylotenera sp.]
MKKNVAIVIAALMVALVLWGLFLENSSTMIVINGQEIKGPLKGMLGAGGLVVTLIALISLAILLALAFAGTGIIIMGCIIVTAGIFTAFVFPFLFPILIPLALIWAFIALIRKK